MKKLNVNECRFVVRYHAVCDKLNTVPAELKAGHHIELIQYSEWRDNKNYKQVHYANYFKTKRAALTKLEKLKEQFNCDIYVHGDVASSVYTNKENYNSCKKQQIFFVSELN